MSLHRGRPAKDEAGQSVQPGTTAAHGVLHDACAAEEGGPCTPGAAKPPTLMCSCKLKRPYHKVPVPRPRDACRRSPLPAAPPVPALPPTRRRAAGSGAAAQQVRHEVRQPWREAGDPAGQGACSISDEGGGAHGWQAAAAAAAAQGVWRAGESLGLPLGALGRHMRNPPRQRQPGALCLQGQAGWGEPWTLPTSTKLVQRRRGVQKLLYASNAALSARERTGGGSRAAAWPHDVTDCTRNPHLI